MSIITDALVMQKAELEGKLKQEYINRLAKIKNLKSDLIKIIIGPRRAGKSFFAMRELSGLGSFAYINFDDESLATACDYNGIIAEAERVYGKQDYLLLDEIQNLPNWELFVNRLQRQGHNLVITGSNANLLSGELSTHLTGRYTSTEILPLSFMEFLSYAKRELTTVEKKAWFEKYSTYGGYPEPLVKDLDYRDYLSTLFDSIVYKDIVKRYKIRKSDVIEELASFIISNSAKEFSYNSFANMTHVESQHTVKKYMGYLSEGFLFFQVSRYSPKIREQITANKKVYCIDNGFISAKAFKASSDKGRLYENLVAIELKRRANGDYSFYYWKNQQQEEVDFVIAQNGRISKLIQVSSDISDEKTKKREIRALLKAGEELRCKNLTVFTEDYEGKEEAEWFGIKGTIRFIPLWKWLLGES